ncbi:hypothetical protein NHL50_08520 [Acidimicrobiia bacterium EGI L10123]|nr:hypothetical protein [Acidimicrobiia bacterium EGI L10123]
MSLASWRRWEAAASSVSVEIAAACERVFTTTSWDVEVADAWDGDGRLTPRQAAALIYILGWWHDIDLQEWLERPDEPLHQVGPFRLLDQRAMMLVDGNRTFAALARERCAAVASELQAGTLPFDRPGCFFDEVLMAVALPEAQELLLDQPDLFETLPERTSELSGDDDCDIADDDWDVVSDGFDDAASWGDWEVPRSWNPPHPLLRHLLNERPPFQWFDPPTPATTGAHRSVIDN